MSSPEFKHFITENNPQTGKPTACVIAISERTDSWPNHHLSEARKKAEAQLGGPVEEVKPDPNSKLGNIPRVDAATQKILVTYRLKTAPAGMTGMPGNVIGQQNTIRPNTDPRVMQAGGFQQQPGSATVNGAQPASFDQRFSPQGGSPVPGAFPGPMGDPGFPGPQNNPYQNPGTQTGGQYSPQPSSQFPPMQPNGLNR
jgi:hypothetical protein